MLTILGAAIVIVVAVDAVWTTLSAAGGGPLTHWAGMSVWRLSVGRLDHGTLKLLGVVILVATVLGWLLILWFGWWLVFLGSETAVLATDTGRPAGPVARIYFAGYAFFTLGVGDFVPGGALWQVLTPLATLNGLFIATLGVTYLVPVASAESEKRSLASMITSLGTRPEGVVVRGWNGRDFRGLESLLATLVPSISLHAQRHLAYPVLHYLHSRRPEVAAPPALARLDEALTLLAFGVAADHRPDAAMLRTVRQALDDYLQTIRPFLNTSTDQPPPPPSLAPLREAGIPVVDEAEFRRHIERLAVRRRNLVRLVESDGWTWSDVGGT